MLGTVVKIIVFIVFIDQFKLLEGETLDPKAYFFIY